MVKIAILPLPIAKCSCLQFMGQFMAYTDEDVDVASSGESVIAAAKFATVKGKIHPSPRRAACMQQATMLTEHACMHALKCSGAAAKMQIGCRFNNDAAKSPKKVNGASEKL